MRTPMWALDRKSHEGMVPSAWWMFMAVISLGALVKVTEATLFPQKLWKDYFYHWNEVYSSPILRGFGKGHSQSLPEDVTRKLLCGLCTTTRVRTIIALKDHNKQQQHKCRDDRNKHIYGILFFIWNLTFKIIASTTGAKTFLSTSTGWKLKPICKKMSFCFWGKRKNSCFILRDSWIKNVVKYQSICITSYCYKYNIYLLINLKKMFFLVH